MQHNVTIEAMHEEDGSRIRRFAIQAHDLSGAVTSVPSDVGQTRSFNADVYGLKVGQESFGDDLHRELVRVYPDSQEEVIVDAAHYFFDRANEQGLIIDSATRGLLRPGDVYMNTIGRLIFKRAHQLIMQGVDVKEYIDIKTGKKKPPLEYVSGDFVRAFSGAVGKDMHTREDGVLSPKIERKHITRARGNYREASKWALADAQKAQGELFRGQRLPVDIAIPLLSHRIGSTATRIAIQGFEA